jgi:6-phosphofructokinase 1
MVIEIMGHQAGWLTLYAGMAGGGDVILIPELDYDIDVVNKYLINRAEMKKDYSIVVVAEGVRAPKKRSAASYISEEIEKGTGIETRKTILGYIQRGGSPSPTDRLLATRFGAAAVNLIAREDYGKMVIKKGEKIKDMPLEEVAGKLRLVPKDHSLIKKAKGLGVCMGGAI